MDLEDVNLNELNDEQIAERMRTTYHEKFKSLARMHLSFELDLNTDEFDLPCHEIVYEDKGKIKKWNRMSKKHKISTPGCGSAKAGSGSASNSPTDALQQHIDAGFLLHLQELKAYLLLDKNITQEGIFRKAGSVSRQNELRLQIQNDKPLDLESSGYSAHDCATVFKSYLAELPEPLLTDAHYPAHLQLAPLCMSAAASSSSSNNCNPERKKREEHLLNSVQLLLQLLPIDSRRLLQDVIDMLHQVAAKAHLNKMTADNLATLFAPHLICPRNLPPEAFHYVSKRMSSFVAYMILRGKDIFGMPAKLSTDIRAYFLERKRKKTMSPEQTLDESISDVSTVNTVYTFVDREKTAAAHNANNTDTELAQLYAYIQSMPESTRKRRLIKQFNKQNGQGTPLQHVMMNRLKNSEAAKSTKSIGDSIKKHIFNNCIISRTPKQTVITNSGMQTPNMSSLKKPKQRVLFQSPTTSYQQIQSISSANNLAASTSCLTPCHNLKAHPLQKSISSSSLLPNSKSANKHTVKSSPVQPLQLSYSQEVVSAPVSRQTSGDLSQSNNALNDVNCCATALKRAISEITDKKSVAWDEDRLLEVVEVSTSCSPAETPNELKSRYKSEPNLSCISHKDKCSSANSAVKNVCALSLTRKLIKGVSMGNLKFPFSTPESTKRIVRSVSSTLKRRSTEEILKETVESKSEWHVHDCTAPLLEDVNDDLDDDTFEDNSADQLDSGEEEEDAENSSAEDADEVEHHDDDVVDALATDNYNILSVNCRRSRRQSGCYRHLLLQQQTNLQRNLDLVTSTPSMCLGRRSMSPITKSTQRMPKAMQESIMTPRSRKPVMVLTNTLGGSSDQNQTIYQTDLSSFREQDEEETSCNEVEATTTASNSHVLTRCQELLEVSKNIIKKSGNLTAPINTKVMLSANMEEKPILPIVENDNDALTTDFKEYLLSRSVLTASPVDSSFSSQPDDFNTGMAQDIDDLDNSQLSPSLLYCLDGNEPDIEYVEEMIENPQNSGLSTHNNARKRAATTTPVKSNEILTSNLNVSEANKENELSEESDSYMLTKKLLISEYPGETSF